MEAARVTFTKCRHLVLDSSETAVGSIIEGREAVEYGIIDEVGGLDSALDALKKMIREVRKINVNGKCGG